MKQVQFTIAGFGLLFAMAGSAYAWPVADGSAGATTLYIRASLSQAEPLKAFMEEYKPGLQFGLKDKKSGATAGADGQTDGVIFCLEYFGPAAADESAQRITRFLRSKEIDSSVIGSLGSCQL